MSDYTITPEAKNYRPTLLINPFHPSITTVVEEEQAKYKVSFNQAYIFDYLGYLNSPVKIENMSGVFDISAEQEKNFCVDIYYNTNDGGVLSGNFREDGPAETTYPLYIQTTDDIPPSEPAVQTIDVCSMDGLSISAMYLRDNIHWWGRLIKQNSSLNTNVAHPIAEPDVLTNQPLIIKSISGQGAPNYKIVDVFDAGETIVVSGVTGFGVMYGEEETYKFLPYPSVAADDNIYVLACNDPLGPPYWLGTTDCP